MASANQIVNQAKDWLGYNEKDGTYKKIIDIYNSQKTLPRSYKVKYSDEWCAVFISALAVKCDATSILPTECSCQKMIELYKDKGMWQENENIIPRIGWIIFYDWNDDGVGDNKGWSDHVGIVEKIVGETMTIIEGNISSKVGRRQINVNAQFIRGYGKPCYEESNETTLDTYELIVPCRVYMNAKNAKSHSYSVGTYKKGKYYVFRKYDGMLNITKKKEVPGAWMNPNDNVIFQTKYYKKYTGTSRSIVDALNFIGVDSRFSHRLKIANANGIKAYIGLPSQNIKLLNLLKSGQLIQG